MRLWVVRSDLIIRNKQGNISVELWKESWQQQSQNGPMTYLLAPFRALKCQNSTSWANQWSGTFEWVSYDLKLIVISLKVHSIESIIKFNRHINHSFSYFIIIYHSFRVFLSSQMFNTIPDLLCDVFCRFFLFIACHSLAQELQYKELQWHE